MRRVLVVPLAALILVGCANMFGQRSVTTEQRPAVEAERPPAQAERPAAPGQPGTPRSTAQAQPDAPKVAEQLTRIAGELSELQNAVAKLMLSSRQMEDQLTHLQRRLRELETQSRTPAPVVPGGFAPPAPAPAPLASPSAAPAEDLYRAGLEKLRAKDVDAALLVFYDLIASYPDHPLRERAQYLVADTLYGRKDYQGALTEFEALLAAVPAGPQTSDALLKIGLCQQALGDRVEARRTWERVVREFPESVAARQARVLLRS